MTADLETAYRARNRTRRQYKGYAHEATLNMLACLGRPLAMTRSETIETICLCFLDRLGKDLSYLDDSTRLRMRALRRAITG